MFSSLFLSAEEHEISHRNRTRKGDDLLTTERIALKSALGGYTLKRKGIDGEDIEYPIKEVIKPGKKIILEGKGMNKEHGSGRGNMIVSFDIVFPDELSEDIKDIMNELLPDLDE